MATLLGMERERLQADSWYVPAWSDPFEKLKALANTPGRMGGFGASFSRNGHIRETRSERSASCSVTSGRCPFGGRTDKAGSVAFRRELRPLSQHPDSVGSPHPLWKSYRAPAPGEVGNEVPSTTDRWAGSAPGPRSSRSRSACAAPASEARPSPSTRCPGSASRRTSRWGSRSSCPPRDRSGRAPMARSRDA